MITADHCDTEIKALKQLMHGRKRSDMRRKWKRRTAFLEKMSAPGKSGKTIKAVLKAHAGRKHRDGLNLDTVCDPQGKTYVMTHLTNQGTTLTGISILTSHIFFSY
jgi:hypothetical protein